jgi:hypothetical protein
MGCSTSNSNENGWGFLKDIARSPSRQKSKAGENDHDAQDGKLRSRV